MPPTSAEFSYSPAWMLPILRTDYIDEMTNEQARYSCLKRNFEKNRRLFATTS